MMQIPMIVVVALLLSIATKAASSPSSEKLLRERYGGAAVERPIGSPAKGKPSFGVESGLVFDGSEATISGDVLKWKTKSTVVVRSKKPTEAFVKTGEVRQKEAPDSLTSVGVGAAGTSRPLESKVIQVQGHYVTQMVDVEIEIHGVASGTVKAGDKISWRVRWAEPHRIGLLLGPAHPRALFPVSQK